MNTIRDIKLSNFKFFSGESVISLNGKHMLMYGENGSGKSSIFWGIYTLLEASMKTASETSKYFKGFENDEESLVNLHAPKMSCIDTHREHYDSYIQINTSENQYVLSLLADEICGDTNVQESRKSSDFINYQAIFKFQEFKNSESPNLYDVFTYSILPYISFAESQVQNEKYTNASAIWEAYKRGPGTTNNKHGAMIMVYKNSADYKNFLKLENNFNEGIKNLIDFINTNSSGIIRKLGYDMEFHLEYVPPKHVKKDKKYEWHPFSIGLVITKYDGVQVDLKRPQSFLNEAKLAAIAISIRLSIAQYRISKVTAPNALKVLVLDDLMISLDMSNRDRLIDLILSEFSSEFQILFLTHDINLYFFVDYKIKQHKQDALWLRKEMYIGEGVSHEEPVIINGECDSFEKAQKYFQSKDYTAAALYIRKSLEEIITGVLPKELSKRTDGAFVELNKLWENLKKYNNTPIPEDIIKLFEQSKLVVLNPAVHYQKISFPIYKKELLSAMDLVKKLKALNLCINKLCIEKNTHLIFKHPVKNYSLEFVLKQDMVKKKNENPMCSIITWQYNAIDFYDFRNQCRGAAINSDNEVKFKKLKSNLMKVDELNIDERCFLENTFMEGYSLSQILS